MSYKEFMMRLSDDVTPEDAQAEYQKYLAQYWGSVTRAEFQQKQNQEWCAALNPPGSSGHTLVASLVSRGTCVHGVCSGRCPAPMDVLAVGFLIRSTAPSCATWQNVQH